ncbi:hypothetical protein ACLHZ0_21150 [Aeromonas salmonicida]|jgi:hypothetical protein|uniref:hypothetical protein n=1 Tax=Aeromonas salmonicida TaxID=645 RepID=UPI003D089E2B
MIIKSEAYIRLLLRFTKTTSEPLVQAVIDHILHGKTQGECKDLYGVTQSNISEKKKRIYEIDGLVQDAIKIISEDKDKK